MKPLLPLSSLLIAIVFSLPAVAADPAFAFSEGNAEIAVKLKDDHGKFTVTSSVGIGRTTITLKDGQWPKTVTFRMQYNDKRGFKMMEGFRLKTSLLEIEGDYRNKDGMVFRFKGIGGKSMRDDLSAGKIAVKIADVDGALEFTLPEGALYHAKKVEFHWVDAYRG